jgi:hypothetical protein
MQPLTASGYVVVGVIILSIVSLAVGSGHTSFSQHGRLKSMLSSAAQVCAQASQDRNPMMAALHANEGSARAQAARQLAGDDTIRRKCGFEVGEIIEACAVQKRKALKRLKRQAPKIALSGDLAHYIS